MFVSILVPSAFLIPGCSSGWETMVDSQPTGSVKEPVLKGAVERSCLLNSEVSSSLCPVMDNALPDLVNSSASLSRCVASGKVSFSGRSRSGVGVCQLFSFFSWFSSVWKPAVSHSVSACVCLCIGTCVFVFDGVLYLFF